MTELLIDAGTTEDMAAWILLLDVLSLHETFPADYAVVVLREIVEDTMSLSIFDVEMLLINSSGSGRFVFHSSSSTENSSSSSSSSSSSLSRILFLVLQSMNNKIRNKMN
ncbi:hypothetical protein AMTR_s00040p00155010 [Amborella trichopoda]|uniref:PH domain-containing protein n=1 Tax=Amborella trichopoda TaxID=13333 RepID=W1PST1_AMBTC|nr:hypothetical protein AMTR_s00040p00155010 [Amborella trichopoda]